MTMDGVPAQSADAAAVPGEAGIVRHQPVFSGRTGEYFGIWFVNLLLSIITLGIYSAWAKVRTERYFYGNTRLAGSTFDYLADPIAILKGRLVAYAVVIALGVSSQFLPVLYLLLILALFALMPAIIVLGLRFRARNSAWRGLSFRFDREIGAAYGPFLGWQVLSAITATLLYPLMKVRQHDFVVGGHSLGRKRFEFSGDGSLYYTPYLIAMGISVLLMVAFFAAFSAVIFAGASVGEGMDEEAAGAAVGYGTIVMMVLLYAGMFALGIFLRVRYANLMWNNTRLGPHRFESTLRVRDMTWLYASNLVAIVCTLGLAVPWAMIRLAHYRAAHFAVLAEGGIDDFVRDLEREHAATGAEMIDALDVGVDLGL
jgi:uncharacterized membrane protein YjgN (DUF898 family)